MFTKDVVDLFLTSRRAKALSKDTLRWYSGILEAFGNSYTELPEKPVSIQQFLASIKTGDERLHGYYRAIRAFYNFLEKMMYCPNNPMKYMEAPRRTKKLPRPITLDEVAQLISYPHSGRVKSILFFLVDTGARPCELVNLLPEQLINTQFGYIARVQGKTGIRLVPLSHETYDSLMSYLPYGVSRGRLRRLVKNAFIDARVNGSAINLRHTFATYWDGDEKVLQYIMGHSHLTTTMIYRALRLGKMAEQHHLYSPLRLIKGDAGRTKL